MKKIFLTLTLFGALALTSCGSHSDADKQQIQDAHNEAREMLRDVKNAEATRPAAAPEAATVAPDSVG